VKALLPAVCLLLSTAAHARFYTRENLPERPRDFERAYAAALRLEEMNSGGDHCSAVSVSRDGYVLTNLHCLKNCLSDAGKALEEITGEHYSIQKPRKQDPKDVVCGNLAWDDSEGNAHVGGRVVWLGRGSQTFSDPDVETIPAAAFRDVVAHHDDFAVLKFDLPGPTACVPASAAPPRAGSRVWNLGYPSFSSRGDGYDSSGYKKHISFGAVTTDIRTDAYLSGVIKTEEQWRRLESAYGQPHILLSIVDSMHGSSGSMIVDEEGELVAIHYSATSPSAERMRADLGANGLSVRVDHIRAELKAGLGEDAARRIFDCPATAKPPVKAPRPPVSLEILTDPWRDR
jgi:hypothetical protein